MDNTNYECSCIGCGGTSDLKMFAHRNPAGKMVGWVFACPGCDDKIADMKLEILQLSGMAELARINLMVGVCGGTVTHDTHYEAASQARQICHFPSR